MNEGYKTNCVVADNWSLQTIAEALSGGLDLGDASLLDVDKNSNSHGYRGVPGGALAVEALFDLIADVVLREQIWVDDEFRQTWEGKDSSLDKLILEGVIIPFPFRNQAHEIDEPRRFFVSKLCFTASLEQAQRENEEEWERSRTSPDQYLAQVVWGGSGMLARALVNRHTYTPFPARRRHIEDAGLFWTPEAEPDAVQILRDLLHKKRARMSVMESDGARITRLRINGSEIAGLAIQESANPQDLLRIALQLRSDYAELRAWLTEYQQALDDNDAPSQRKCENLLRSASSFIDARLGHQAATGPTFTFGWGLMQFSQQGNPWRYLLNRFGVRAQINRLAFGQSSSQELTKLLTIFGQRARRTGLEIADYFQESSKSPQVP